MGECFLLTVLSHSRAQLCEIMFSLWTAPDVCLHWQITYHYRCLSLKIAVGILLFVALQKHWL